MKDRILTTTHGQFHMRDWDGENRSGIRPICDKVLVLVDPAMQKTKGGILLTDQNAETQTMSSTTGVVIAVGEQAFVWDSDRSTRWEGNKPKAGDRVYFQKYAGQEYTGHDGDVYRLLQDRSIAGVGVVEVEAVSVSGAAMRSISGNTPRVPGDGSAYDPRFANQAG